MMGLTRWVLGWLLLVLWQRCSAVGCNHGDNNDLLSKSYVFMDTQRTAFT